MASIGLITELEVVNSVLSVAGDNPIQSLSDTYQPTFIIRQMIKEESRKMQTKRYWFNSEYDFTLQPNTETNKITLPFNLLSFEPVKNKYVARGLTVYNREDNTETITEDIVADISVFLEFDELPQEAREFIKSRCRQRYNNEFHGDNTLDAKLERELRDSKNELDKKNMENEDFNVFKSRRGLQISRRY